MTKSKHQTGIIPNGQPGHKALQFTPPELAAKIFRVCAQARAHGRVKLVGQQRLARVARARRDYAKNDGGAVEVGLQPIGLDDFLNHFGVVNPRQGPVEHQLTIAEFMALNPSVPRHHGYYPLLRTLRRLVHGRQSNDARDAS